ncbi:hypothetical protein ACLB1E_04430 [Escherichia coli]
MPLPSLPYAYDALEPHLDKQTMEIHQHQTPSDLRQQRQRGAGKPARICQPAG